MATIQISDLDTLIAFFNGDHGQGSSAEHIEAVLTKDLDFADKGIYYWAGSNNAPTTTWYADFDGQGHSIKNISSSGEGKWFLFEALYDGYLINLNIEDINITATGNVALVNQLRGKAVVQNVHVTGKYKGTTVAGISIGSNSGNTKVRGCSFHGEMEGTNAAGISYNTVSVTGSNRIMNCAAVAKINVTGTGAGIAYTSGWTSGSFFRGTIKAGTIYPLISGSNRCTESYVVLEEGTTGTIANITQQNTCVYDADVAAAAGLTVQGLTAATTLQIKDPGYMRNAGYAT